MQNFIVFIVSNFTLTFFILGAIFTIASLKIHSKKNKAMIIETIFSYFLFFNIFLSYFFNFIMHVFFGQISAEFIGWTQSPFQLEVGFASLGFAITGLISVWSSISFRAATIISVSVFLLGAAGGHVYQMITEHNFSSGNAGVIFFTDIFIPVFSFMLLWLQYKNPAKNN